VPYDAFLLLSFGGPEHPDDVMPFLRNVTRGRGVPDERLAEVAEHYYHFGGVSPINQQCRDLLAAIEADFAANGIGLPAYWGNRNWRPMLADTVAQMRDDGVTSALGFATSAYGGYSSCRQYWEDIAAARAHVGPRAPAITKLRQFHDHPGFVHRTPTRCGPRSPRSTRPGGQHAAGLHRTFDPGVDGRHGRPARRPVHRPAAGDGRARARRGGAGPALGPGVAEPLRSSDGAVASPDINEHLAALAEKDVTDVVVSPIGFVSDHLEVVWDLDHEAAQTAAGLGMEYVRAGTPGTDPRFVAMVRSLVLERIAAQPRQRLGTLPVWDVCPAGCCPPHNAEEPHERAQGHRELADRHGRSARPRG
jgi:ferrochelatase